MSIINLIIVEKNWIYLSQVHYRYVLDLLHDNLRKIQKIKHFARHKYYLDAGYFVIDMNQKTIISNQGGFSINHLAPKTKQTFLRDWEYIDQLR